MFRKPRNIEYVNKVEERSKCGARWWAVLVLLVVLVSALLLSACNIDDDRDICCEEVILDYRYVRAWKDEFKFFIENKRHFLFDGAGILVGEVPAELTNPQRVVLRDLPPGSYTMLTVANHGEGSTSLTPPVAGETTLEEARLALAGKVTGEASNGVTGGNTFGAADELFWNSRRFEFKRNEVRRYICDMANIHCHLFMKVEWEDLPPDVNKGFSVELTNLTAAYEPRIDEPLTLRVAGKPAPGGDGDEPTPGYVVHHFPRHEAAPLCTVRVAGALRGHELYAELRTLRYLDDRVPTLQLLHDGERLFDKPIDLTPVFHDWGWYPNLAHEQVYWISLKVLKGGLVEVKPWFQSGVLDWIDGGSF